MKTTDIIPMYMAVRREIDAGSPFDAILRLGDIKRRLSVPQNIRDQKHAQVLLEVMIFEAAMRNAFADVRNDFNKRLLVGVNRYKNTYGYREVYQWVNNLASRRKELQERAKAARRAEKAHRKNASKGAKTARIYNAADNL